MIAHIGVVLAVLVVGICGEKEKDIHAFNDTSEGLNRFHNHTDHEIEEEGELHISRLLGDFYKKFENMTGHEAHEAFEKNIIPDIDHNADGIVTFTEVKEWVMKMAEESVHLKIPKDEYEAIDTNHDGRLSLEEVITDYKKHRPVDPEDAFDTLVLLNGIKKEAARFKFADVDKDGFVYGKELLRMVYPDHFRDFLQLLKEDFKIDHDVNEDGIITRKEFVRSSEDHDQDTADAHHHFGSHDVNKDDKLDDQEVTNAVEIDNTFHAVLDELKEIFLIENTDIFTGMDVHRFAELHHFFTDKSASLSSHDNEHDEL